ncbi:MAG TPA: hydroxyacylglutathione hydrolase [Kofleriaceae bacterium]|nr:hydroxyacylglutathione hydrolase [Kofleriaceae bacterium]
MRVLPIPCLADNYAYLVIEGTYAAIVDPSTASPVLEVITREGVTPTAIWLTHHHWDHVGGVEGIVAAYPSIEVVAHKSDQARSPKVTKLVDEGDVVELGPVRAKIIYNPGHTLGAISYWIEDGDGAVFTGDTLFAAGCGRVFEGTPEMMYASLTKLAALPPTTRVYFGHEYTAANLKFAAHVEPANQAIATRLAGVKAPTTPSTIADERATNPFLLAKDAAEFAARREAKNNFK